MFSTSRIYSETLFWIWHSLDILCVYRLNVISKFEKKSDRVKVYYITCSSTVYFDSLEIFRFITLFEYQTSVWLIVQGQLCVLDFFGKGSLDIIYLFDLNHSQFIIDYLLKSINFNGPRYDSYQIKIYQQVNVTPKVIFIFSSSVDYSQLHPPQWIRYKKYANQNELFDLSEHIFIFLVGRTVIL